MAAMLDDERTDWWDPDDFSAVAPFSIIAYITFVIFVICFVGSVDLRRDNKRGPCRILFFISTGLVCRVVWELCHYGDKVWEMVGKVAIRDRCLASFNMIQPRPLLLPTGPLLLWLFFSRPPLSHAHSLTLPPPKKKRFVSSFRREISAPRRRTTSHGCV